jgi:hypothetical protein
MIKCRHSNYSIDGMCGDMLVVSILAAIQALFGLLWLIASAVHSVANAQAYANAQLSANNFHPYFLTNLHYSKCYV